jgi:hypothetical protein
MLAAGLSPLAERALCASWLDDVQFEQRRLKVLVLLERAWSATGSVLLGVFSNTR